MALLTVSGEPGCRVEEIARLAAQRLGFELFAETALHRLVEEQFGQEASLPDKAWPHLLASILARLTAEHHLVVSLPGAQFLLREYPGALRLRLVAPVAYRVGMLMLDQRLERPAAAVLLKRLDHEQKDSRRRRFGRATAPADQFDLTLNTATMDAEAIVGVIQAAVENRQLIEQGLLPPTLAAEIQFQVRLQLAKHSIRPPGDVSLERTQFGHPSEQIFAHLLDFYRIPWEYEPRSFALEWDESGSVLEAFTPDFYLPEFDLYIELTTMKQALVTKKNRKLRRLQKIYPEVNIQIFYQKDFQNLIFKYGLADRTIQI